MTISKSNEIWRPVVGYEGVYEVSDRGRVRRVGSFSRFGKIVTPAPRVIATSLTNSGYAQVHLWQNNKKHSEYVHHLVLRAFKGECPAGHEAAHLNGRRDDNRPQNLSWLTHAENMAQKFEHGTVLHGNDCPASNLRAHEIAEIRRRASAGETQRALAAAFGTTQSNISLIVLGKNWRRSF